MGIRWRHKSACGQNKRDEALWATRLGLLVRVYIVLHFLGGPTSRLICELFFSSITFTIVIILFESLFQEMFLCDQPVVTITVLVMLFVAVCGVYL
jgi:hypothetical protein